MANSHGGPLGAVLALFEVERAVIAADSVA